MLVTLHRFNSLETPLRETYEWCQSMNMSKSPTVVIDNRPIPYVYGPEDFEFLLTNTFEELQLELQKMNDKKFQFHPV